MRLPGFHASHLVTNGHEAPGVPAACAPEVPLLGSWSATRWQYAGRDGDQRATDVICDLGGSVTLSLSTGTYVLSCDVRGRGKLSVGGTYRIDGDQLELFPLGAPRGELVRFSVSAETLSLRAEESLWDFDGRGETPAEFVAVFVRL